MIDAATASGTGAIAPAPRAPWRARLVGVAASILVLLSVALLLHLGSRSQELTLVLRDPGTGEVLHHRSVAAGERFELQHTHSVTRRPVVETFGVEERSGLTLEGMVFDHPGPNLPTGPERFGEQMTTFTTVDGVYRVEHHGYPIGRVTIRVGTAAVDHTLVFDDGGTLRLLDLSRAGGAIEFEVLGATDPGPRD